MLATRPDLSALNRAQANTLAQIAGAAVLTFITRADEAQDRLRGEPNDRWMAQAEHDLAEARRLEREARILEQAARQRAKDAGRDECVAVRMIHAFAIAAMREPAPLSAAA